MSMILVIFVIVYWLLPIIINNFDIVQFGIIFNCFWYSIICQLFMVNALALVWLVYFSVINI